MKRKIALLLAGVMALTTVPVMNVFAATDNYLSGSPVVIEKEKDTMFAQQQMLDAGFTVDEDNFDDVAPIGLNLVVQQKQGSITPNDIITLTLENAKWALDKSGLNSAGTVTVYPTEAGSVSKPFGYTVSSASLMASMMGSAFGSSEYKFEVSRGSDNQATVTPIDTLSGSGNKFVIPVVAIANGAGDAKITVSGNNVTTGTYTFATVGEAPTTAVVKSAKTGTDSFKDIEVVIKESKAATLDSGYIILTAPEGVTFSGSPAVYGELGLSNQPGWVGTGRTITNGASPFVKNGKTITIADNEMLVDLTGLTPSKSTAGQIYIGKFDLNFDEDDFTAGDVIELDVADYEDSATAPKAVGAGVSDTTFKAGTVVNYGVTFSAETAKELVAGKYVADPLDDAHKAARVTFKENAVDSWASKKETTFTLPEGVKFRAVKFKTADGTNDIGSIDEKVLYSSNIATNKVKVSPDTTGSAIVKLSDDTLTFKGVTAASGKKIEIAFDAYLSIDPTFTGDVELAVAGGAVEAEPVVIATTVQPFTFSYANGTLTVTENFVGAFKKDTEMWVTLADNKETKEFSKSTKATETTNAIDLDTSLKKNKRTSGASLAGDVYTIKNKKLSTTKTGPATFEVTNIPTDTDATYLSISGNAVAANYDIIAEAKDVSGDYLADLFDTSGIIIDLAPATTSTSNQGSGLVSTEVRIAIGGPEGAFVDAKNNTMVPFRALLNLLGLSDEKIIWDAINKTATAVLPNGTLVQITVDSPIALVNGIPVPMTDAAGLPVAAKIVNGRFFLPMRAMGNLLNIPVGWDANTKEAIYNPVAK